MFYLLMNFTGRAVSTLKFLHHYFMYTAFKIHYSAVQHGLKDKKMGL